MDKQYRSQSYGIIPCQRSLPDLLFFNAGTKILHKFIVLITKFVVFIELVGTCVLPAAIGFTIYVIVIAIVRRPVPIIPLVLLGLILGLPAILIVLTAKRWSYVGWMLIYLLSLLVWNFILPLYAFWNFDDFSWYLPFLSKSKFSGAILVVLKGN